MIRFQPSPTPGDPVNHRGAPAPRSKSIVTDAAFADATS
jgi:hypothetical protein